MAAVSVKRSITATKIPSRFGAHLFAFDSRETQLYKRVSLAQIHFLLLLRNNSPAYEISHLQVELPRENLSKYKQPCD